MTYSMETLATAAHEVEGVSTDIASVADEQRHTDVTLQPLTGKGHY